MDAELRPTYTAFRGERRLAAGTLEEVARAVLQCPPDEPVLVFSDATGAQVEPELRAAERPPAVDTGLDSAATPARARGRPRLGVVAREVTLLPAHWDWLAAQPGGASVALRKLVHQAMRSGSGRERARRAQERSYKVMAALGGDRPGFEEAARALFAGEGARLAELLAAWPHDIREHVLRLADPGFEAAAG